MMRRSRLWPLIGAAVVAVIVESTGVLGTWAWDRVAGQLRRDADAGAAAIIQSSLLRLPPAVLRSRRLFAGDLLAAKQQMVVGALDTLARRQIRCMVVHPEGYLNLARAQLIQGQAFDGQVDLAEAIKRDPTRPFAIRLQALVSLLLGRFDEAMDLLAQAEAVAPGFRVPSIELADADEARVRLEGLERRLEVYPRIRVETLISIGQSLRGMGLQEEAVRRLEQAAGDPRADLVRAQWALTDGDVSVAAGMAQGLAQQRRLPLKIRAAAWSLLARALEIQGDSEGALAATRRALQLAPNSAAPHLALARIAQGRGDLEGAVEHYRRAWGMDPSNVDILVQFALAAERVGLLADARLALERTVKLRPGDTSAVVRLADFQLRTGALMDATMTLSRGLDRAPADPNLLKMAERLRREVAKR